MIGQEASQSSAPTERYNKDKKEPLGVPAIKQVYMSNNDPPKVIKDYFRRFCYFL